MKFFKKLKYWEPSTYSTIVLLIFPFIIFVLREFNLDNDFWFLINTGRTILEKGFITIEPFTIHENLFFIPQQWLTDIIFYIVYDKFNILGMFILELIINGVIVFLIYKLSLLISNKRKTATFTTIFIDGILIIYNILTSRPQMFDIIIFLLELYLIESYIRKNKKIYLYFLPLISLLLINIHSSLWIMFFVLLMPYYFEYIYNKIKRKETYKIKTILLITIISSIMGFINPYSYHAILYLFNSYGIKEINLTVGEMKPINITNLSAIYFLILFDFCIIYKNKGNNKIRYILLFLGTTYLVLSHYKGILYYLIVEVVLISDCFFPIQRTKVFKISELEKIIDIMIIVGIVIYIPFNVNFYNESEMPIKEIVDYLDQNTNKDIKLFTGYNEGSYLEYRGYKCYIDPRAEVFLKNNNKKEDIFIEYYNLNNKVGNVQTFIDKYNFDYLLLTEKHELFLYEIKKNDNYELVKETKDNRNKETYYLYKYIKEE